MLFVSAIILAVGFFISGFCLGVAVMLRCGAKESAEKERRKNTYPAYPPGFFPRMSEIGDAKDLIGSPRVR